MIHYKRVKNSMEEISIVRTNNLYVVYKNTASNQIPMQHYHDAYEIVFFINIDLEVFIKDTRYEIHNGDIIFINELDIHRFIYKETSTAYNRYLINFKKDYIFPILKAAGIECILDDLKESRYAHASTTLKERSELEFLFKSMLTAKNLYSGTLPNSFQEANLKSYLLLILIRIWHITKNNKKQNSMTKKGKLVKELIKFVDKNYMSEISLKMLEENFHLDRYHISHVFKDITDFSIIEYVQQRRVIEAQKMLKYSNKEIVDICFDCGFNNIQHFHRVFKKISGLTPNKYRKL